MREIMAWIERQREKPGVDFVMRNAVWLPAYAFMVLFLVTGAIPHYGIAVALSLIPVLSSVRET